MILIFFGPPGAGKGTQAKLLADYLKLPHLSTGDILRNKLNQKDELSNKLRIIMDKGQLVSDDIMNEIVSNRIDDQDCTHGFILDGYPRTVEQALFLDTSLTSKKLRIDRIIDIEVDEITIVKRIKLRSNIENRKDDTEEVIKTRILKYQSETKQLSDFYRSDNSLNYSVINGNQDIETIYLDIIKIIKNEEL